MNTYKVYLRIATGIKNSKVTTMFIEALTPLQAYWKSISRFPNASIQKMVRVQ